MQDIADRVKYLARSVVPPSMFHHLHDLPFAVTDLKDRNWKGTDRLPPLRLQRDGPRGSAVFVENGMEAQRFYEEVVKLDRSARMLDIGSGIGRKTIPLLDYLEPDGRYVGLDIDRTLVSWCSNHITRRDPRFVFLHISVYNSFYNPDGALEPHDYRFPFADESFDAVALWSVFTHLLPDSIANYVNEISRMLRPDGTLIGSFFLINDESRQAITDGTTAFPALYNEGDYWTTNRNMPEHMVAVPEEWLHQQLDAAGLRATDVRLGTWTGTRQADDRFPNLGVQDVVIARPV